VNEANSLRILRTLDKYLEREIDLVVYGKSALHLLYDGDSRIGVTNDVDLIVPEIQVKTFDQRVDFWDALEKTNEELESTGLYLSHIFDEKQVILHPSWFSSKLKILIGRLNHLNIFVPSPMDLILTKMMRIDPLDRADMVFIFEKSEIKPEKLQNYCLAAICPDQLEIRDAFENNKSWLREQGMV